jgi:hypothetical protein
LIEIEWVASGMKKLGPDEREHGIRNKNKKQERKKVKASQVNHYYSASLFLRVSAPCYIYAW